MAVLFSVRGIGIIGVKRGRLRNLMIKQKRNNGIVRNFRKSATSHEATRTQEILRKQLLAFVTLLRNCNERLGSKAAKQVPEPIREV